MRTTWVRLRASLTDDEIEDEARRLCRTEGMDPDAKVAHSYGEDFTGEEWARFQPRTDMYRQLVSPFWRVYRGRAAIELCRRLRDVKVEGNVVAFRPRVRN